MTGWWGFPRDSKLEGVRGLLLEVNIRARGTITHHDTIRRPSRRYLCHGWSPHYFQVLQAHRPFCLRRRGPCPPPGLDPWNHRCS